jgi:transposase
MGRRMFSEDFKKSTVEKFLNRGNRSVKEIAHVAGVTTPSLYDWCEKFGKTGDMKKSSKPNKKTPSEKLNIIIEYGNLAENLQGEFLRKNGLHEQTISEWKKQIESALSSSQKPSVDKSELVSEQKKVQQLEKEIRRKDKALAEATALLILKKKADLIWGSEEEE